MSTTPEVIATVEHVEDWVESTPYGELPTRSRCIESVRRWPKGNLELSVAYWRNNIRLPGYATGNPDEIARVLGAAGVKLTASERIRAAREGRRS